MAPTIPTVPPTAFRAGDTVKFTVDHADYSASDSWVIAFTVNGPSKAAASSVVSVGTRSTVTLAAAATAQLTPGTYAWTLVATKSGERYTIAGGVVSVLPDTSAAAAGSLQSNDERELAYLNAEIQARLQSDHTEYTVDGRSLKREPLAELMEWRDMLRARIARRRRGGGLATVAVQFPVVGPGAG